jgi:excisionase family DNA binding protein
MMNYNNLYREFALEKLKFLLSVGAPPQTKNNYSITEAAVYLQASDKTVRRLIQSGKLPSSKIANKHRILKSDMDAYIRSQAVPPPVQTRRGARCKQPVDHAKIFRGMGR